ncbi:MAG: tRNA 2-selenouridine(34) synthase MnmH [Prolixibacteraceae bacterium]|nr:tRNA 2-selenouridine(34) synthase MnmH [Prolixibacteraceae bacterium]
MSTTVNISQFLELAQTLPVVDVRSPGEYRQGHIEGAVNIPLFSDEERAAVGTAYVQEGRSEAVLQGLEFTGKKMRVLCESAFALNSRQLLIYCWRGGMRSQSMSWLFEVAGLQCFVLGGGYKIFRRAVLDEMATPRRLHILSGYTGSGKTEILAELKNFGQQVIDLEALANHRGSAFGGLGQAPQPTVEQFENMLFAELQKTDKTQPLWLEDESINIGKIQITHSFFDLMKQAMTLQITVSQPERIRRLVREYGGFEYPLLAEAIKKIEKRTGSDRCQQALKLCAAGELAQVAKILLDYYDKAYEFQNQKHLPETLLRLDIPDGANVSDIAKQILKSF